VWLDVGLTIVDALDTLLIMGLDDEVEEAGATTQYTGACSVIHRILTGASHVVHHIAYRCTPRHPPHNVPVLATSSTT
jgi:hypothetical protein